MQVLLAGPPREVTVRPHIAAIILTSLLQKVKRGMAELGRDPNLLSSSLVFLTPFVSACLSVCLLVSDSDSVSVCLFLSLSLSACLSVCLPLSLCSCTYVCLSIPCACVCLISHHCLSSCLFLPHSPCLCLCLSLFCVCLTPTHPPYQSTHKWCVCVCVCVRACVRACLCVCVGGGGAFVRLSVCAWAYDLSAAVLLFYLFRSLAQVAASSNMYHDCTCWWHSRVPGWSIACVKCGACKVTVYVSMLHLMCSINWRFSTKS